MGDRLFKMVGAAAAIGATAATRQAITHGWKLVMASDPPSNPEDPDTSWGEAVAWAVVSGAAVAIVRLYVTRQATRYYRNATGELPQDASTL